MARRGASTYDTIYRRCVAMIVTVPSAITMHYAADFNYCQLIHYAATFFLF